MAHKNFSQEMAIQEISDYKMELGFIDEYDQNSPLSLDELKNVGLVEFQRFSMSDQNAIWARIDNAVREFGYNWSDFLFYNEKANADQNWEYIREGRQEMSELGSSLIIWIGLVGLVACAIIASSPTTWTGIVLIEKICTVLQGL